MLKSSLKRKQVEWRLEREGREGSPGKCNYSKKVKLIFLSLEYRRETMIKHLKFVIAKDLLRDVKLQIKEAEWTLNRTSLNASIPRHNIIKLLKIKNKEKS